MRAFILLWLGQLASGFGSTVSIFAFGVWIFQQTGSATQFALTSFFFVLPLALLSSVAGTLVDRWNRRWVMIAADSGQAVITGVIALLLFTGQLAVWHLYLAAIASALCGAFHGPAWGASIPLLVPEQQLTRAAGLGQISKATAHLLAPVVAGYLVITIGLAGIVLIDLVTFVFALVTYLAIEIPTPPSPGSVTPTAHSFWQDLLLGWRYILTYPGLLGIVLIGTVVNFPSVIAHTLTTPLVLAFASADALGVVLATGASGLFLSGLLLSLWRGRQRRMVSALGLLALSGVGTMVAGWLPLVWLVAVGRLLAMFGGFGSGSLFTAIEQSKVPNALQGRVFGAEGMLALLFEALAYPSAGLLADHIFEPLLLDGYSGLGSLLPTGPGRGTGLLCSLMGVGILLLALAGYLHPRIRQIEEELPAA